MLSKPVYELAPFGYMLLGALCVLKLETSLGVLGGSLLYAMGAVVWVMRSNFRRGEFTRPKLKQLFLPEHLYELKPFLVIAVAMLCYRLSGHPLGLLIAALLGGYGVYMLLLRSKNRQRHMADYSGRK